MDEEGDHSKHSYTWEPKVHPGELGRGGEGEVGSERGHGLMITGRSSHTFYRIKGFKRSF